MRTLLIGGLRDGKMVEVPSLNVRVPSLAGFNESGGMVFTSEIYLRQKIARTARRGQPPRVVTVFWHENHPQTQANLQAALRALFHAGLLPLL